LNKNVRLILLERKKKLTLLWMKQEEFMRLEIKESVIMKRGELKNKERKKL